MSASPVISPVIHFTTTPAIGRTTLSEFYGIPVDSLAADLFRLRFTLTRPGIALFAGPEAAESAIKQLRAWGYTITVEVV